MTTHRKKAPAAKYEREPVHAIRIEPWRDTRAAAKAKAQSQTDEMRCKLLWRVASENRRDALAMGRQRYIGTPCSAHDGNSERYSASGQCTMCSRDHNARRRIP